MGMRAGFMEEMCSNEEEGGGAKAALWLCSSTSTKVLFLVFFSYLPTAEAFWNRMEDGGGGFCPH